MIKMWLRENCQNTEFFWPLFSHILTEYEDLLRKSPYSVQIPENPDQKNSVFGHFSLCVTSNGTSTS